MRNLTKKPADRTRRKPSEKRSRLNSCLRVERLEERALMAGDVTISITDATIYEVSNGTTFTQSDWLRLDNLVDLAFGPSRNDDSVPDLYLVGNLSNNVIVYDGETGAFLEEFVSVGLNKPAFITFGADGDLFVATATTGGERDSILRVDQDTKAVTTFVPASANGGLLDARGMAFGIDGNLYVASRLTDEVLRYNGTTGAFLGEFVVAGVGDLDDPGNILFGPDRNGDYLSDLYVSSNLTDEILVYDGVNGAPLGAFVSAGSAGLDLPNDMEFGADGNLYVVPSPTAIDQHVYRFEGTTGAPLTGIELPGAPFITFDNRGDLYRSNRSTNNVVRYSAGPLVTLSTPSDVTVSVDFSTVNGTALAGVDYEPVPIGTLTFQPGDTIRRILLASKDDTDVDANETFSVNLSNPTGGASIEDDGAVVTITDDDDARSFNIMDASAIEGDHDGHYRGTFVHGFANAHFNPIAFGPDGNLYTSVGTGPGYNTIRRYNGTTGAFIDTFMKNDNVANPINGVRDIAFRGAYMYVGSEYTDEVLRYDATTGVFVDVFVAAGSGGIDGPHGLAFGPDSNGDGVPELYVSGRDSFSVVRYDGVTGSPLGKYVTAKSGGLSYPEGITFDPSGTYLYVANTGFEQIRRYDARTGASLGIFASGGLSVPKDVKFGPDGLLYVASGGNYRIRRFTADGAIVDDYVPAGSGGMINPSRLAFGPDGNLFVTMVGNSEIMRFGSESEAVLTVSLSTPSLLPLNIGFGTANGNALAGIDYISTAGTVTFPAGVTRQTILIPTFDDSVVESQETFTVNIYDAVGGNIADGSAIVTITDDDEVVLDTKFYVVDDASTNRTYEYDALGGSTDSYSLDTGNSAPRGVASHITGQTIWVVDANKKVYVYNNSGGLLGSWTAGSLPSNAQVEGITTNGTDIWIVDNRSDRVYRYSGAATRLSGSQNAFGNFGLNSGNRNPKDIVTDGAFLYVVDDSTTDKVFKYQISNNALVASWTITTQGATSPTGITLDPSNPSHLWIVDNGSDSVYEYRNAVNQANGTSKSADASFALALGNTNPQGIADPPAPGKMQPVGSPLATQSAQQSSDSDPAVNGSRAVAVDFAMLQVFGMSRPDAIATQSAPNASVALASAMRRSREAKVSSIAPFAPTAAPQRETQTDSAQSGNAAQQAIDELLTLWQSDLLPNRFLSPLS